MNGRSMTDIARIAFAAPPGATAPTGKFKLTLADRSVLTVADLTCDGDKFTITLTGKPSKTVVVPVHAVTGVEQINGPVQWVSSMIPIESAHT